MSSVTADREQDAPESRVKRTTIQPVWVRIAHWINAVVMIVMILSGWRIYNASPIFNFVFPSWVTIGGWLGGALLWHFAAMWLPISASGVVNETAAALKGQLSHDDLSVYNNVQKLLYVGVILAGILVVLSGLSIWKPVQLQELTAVFGGYDNARIVHFAAMASIVAFLVVHVVLAVLVPKSLRAMITGR